MTLMEPTATQPAPPESVAFPVVAEYIGVRPGYCGGRPHILGHRIKVKHVADWYDRQGLSPAEIVAQFPTITLAQVHAALAYYYDHRDEIAAEWAEEDRIVGALEAAQESLGEKARKRAADAASRPLPPR